MATIGTKIRDRVFRTPADVLAAKRDDTRITKIETSYDLNRLEVLEKILRDFEANRFHFETLLGEDFREEVEERYEKALKESQNALTDTKAKGKKQHKEKNESIDKKKAKTERENSKLSNKSKKSKKEEKSLEDFDPLMQQHILKELKKQKRKQRLLYILLSIVAFSCLSYVVFYYVQYEKNEAEYEALAEMKNEDLSSDDNQINITYTEEDKNKPAVLKKYESLYQKNKKLVGWIKIEDTKIDYPVMQTVNNEYYLDHNYNQEYDKNGSIFMDKDCTPAFPNTNMIIYGHHMKSGRMFGDLDRYKSEDYFKKHPQILFDTIYEEGKYDVMYAFNSRIYNADEVVFKYYQFMDVNSEEEFYSAMDEMARISLYDTGVTAEYGDKLITLSTCDHSETDGRFVVVAKKVK